MTKHLSILFLILVIIFSSCTTSQVVSSHFIQKRKYNKGYHIVKKKNIPPKSSIDESSFANIESEINFNSDSKEPFNRVKTPSNKEQDIESIIEKVEQKEVNENKPLIAQSSIKTTKEPPFVTRQFKKIINSPLGLNYNQKSAIQKMKSKNGEGGKTFFLILLVILIPPVAVLIVRGANKNFWLSLFIWIATIILGLTFPVFYRYSSIYGSYTEFNMPSCLLTLTVWFIGRIYAWRSSI